MTEKQTITLTSLPFEPSSDELIYIEGRYDKAINRVLSLHWRELNAQFTADYGLQFWYLPQAFRCISNAQLRWHAPSIKAQEARQVVRIPLPSLLDFEEGTHHKYSMPPAIGRLKETGWGVLGRRYTMEYVPLKRVSERNYMDVFDQAVRQLTQCVKFKEPATEDQNDEADYDDSGPQVMLSIWRGYLRKKTASPECTYNADSCFNEEVLELLAEAQQRIDKLRVMGVSEMVLSALVRKEQKASRMVITRDYRILLPDYGDMEIEMPPLVKAVYFLFLRHRNGFAFIELERHRHELGEIYRILRGGVLSDKARRSIDAVTDCHNNSINEKCARIREAFLLKMRHDLASKYFIYGGRNSRKSISLNRKSVIWETDINKYLPEIICDPDDFHQSFVESAHIKKPLKFNPNCSII